MSKSDLFLLNKAKVWAGLHGLVLNKPQLRFCGQCPHFLQGYSRCRKRMKREIRLMYSFKENSVILSFKSFSKGIRHCLEWVRYV